MERFRVGARSAEELIGRVYEVRRANSASFEQMLEFHDGGRLVVHVSGQSIEEKWCAAGCDASSIGVVLGGLNMPTANVIIGPSMVNPDCDGLCEFNPPGGAPPMVGNWQRSRSPSDPKADPSQIAQAQSIHLIVDRSGSMRPLHDATVTGLRRFLEEQRNLPHADRMTVTLTTFDDKIEQPWGSSCALVQSNGLVPVVNASDVAPRGMTALLDAIGSTLASTSLLPPQVVCIVTDGLENSSTRFQHAQVMQLIRERQNSGWTFIFLAANQDAIRTGGELGILGRNCATFSATAVGIENGFGSASAASCRGALFGNNASAFTVSERAACLK